MDQLATLFGLLRQGNGEPDCQARQSELDSLIKHLSLPEIRRLRLQLSHLPVCDICDFPWELIIRIFVKLPLEDVLSLRRVSQKWNKVLSSTDFCHNMTKEHFRSDWIRLNEQIGHEYGLKDKIAMKELFRNASIRHIRKSYGLYHSMEAYWHHMPPRKPQDCEEYQYSNGRLGYKADPESILVKELRSESKTRIYMDENREPFRMWLLSDTYLIYINRSNRIFACRLDSAEAERPVQVHLPNKARNISACQGFVAIVTVGYDVLIWTVGGPLELLDTSEAKNELQILPSHSQVLWDLTNDGHFFVVYFGSVDDLVAAVVIQRFPDIKKVYRAEYADPSETRRGPPPMLMLQAGIIGLINDRERCFSRNSKFYGCDPGPNYWSFNTYTNCVMENHFPLPSMLDGKERATNISAGLPSTLFHFWRDQIFIPAYLETDGGGKCSARQRYRCDDFALLTSICALSTSPRPTTNWTTWNTYTSGVDSTSSGSSDTRINPAARSWNANGKLAESLNHHQRMDGPLRDPNWSRVMGDDDFVVLCGRYGFVVWCFDKNVKLPTELRWTEPYVSQEESGSRTLHHPLSELFTDLTD